MHCCHWTLLSSLAVVSKLALSIHPTDGQPQSLEVRIYVYSFGPSWCNFRWKETEGASERLVFATGKSRHCVRYTLSVPNTVRSAIVTVSFIQSQPREMDCTLSIPPASSSPHPQRPSPVLPLAPCTSTTPMHPSKRKCNGLLQHGELV
jgi:hypothetical protein